MVAGVPSPHSQLWRWELEKLLKNVVAGLSSPIFTGDPQAPTPPQGDSDTSIATTAYVAAAQSRRNRVVNGAMLISQELADTGSSTSAAYIADQWQCQSTMAMSSARELTPTDGSRIRITNAAAKASLAATDAFFFNQRIEGNRVRDFMWGTGNARPAVARFEVYSPVAGTFAFGLGNQAGTHSFVYPFTIPAGVWTPFTAPIPAQTAGVWPLDTAAGAMVTFAFAAGSAYLAPAAGWHTVGTNYLGVTGMTNGVATASQSFYVRNVGLYIDPTGIGLAPPWENPDYAEELAACQRYFWRWNPINFHFNFASGVAAPVAWFFNTPVTMRVQPVMSGSFAGASYGAASGLTVDLSQPDGFRMYLTTTGAAGGNCVPAAANFVHANARI